MHSLDAKDFQIFYEFNDKLEEFRENAGIVSH